MIEPRTYYNEQGYLDLIHDILCQNVEYPDRTGTGCKKLFGARLVFDLQESFPKATVRKTPLRIAFQEFWMFLRGTTNTKWLEDKGIKIWQGNTSREFLDSRGMTAFPEGSMGYAYGYQLRNFGGVHDQLREVYDNLRDDPFSRRHYVSMWCPSMNQWMALLPCWHSHQFCCEMTRHGDIVLHLHVQSRSADVVYGMQFNYQQYALYLKAMAESLGYEAGTLICNIADAHVYRNQYEYAAETLKRNFDVSSTRSVTFKKPLDSLEDIMALSWEDIEDKGQSVNTEPYKATKPSMAV